MTTTIPLRDVLPADLRAVTGYVALAVAALGHGAAPGLLLPLLHALSSGEISAAAGWAATLTAAAAAIGVVEWYGVRASRATGYEIPGTMLGRIGALTRELPVDRLTGSGTGTLHRLLTRDVDTVSGVPAHLVGKAIRALFTPIAAIAVALWAVPAIGTVLTVGLAVVLVAFHLTGRVVADAEQRIHAAAAQVSTAVVDFARNQQLYRLFGARATGIETAADALRERGLRLLRPAMSGFATVSIAAQLVLAVVLVQAARIEGEVDAAALVTVLVLAARCTESVVSAAELGAAMRMAGNALVRIRDLLGTPGMPAPAHPLSPADASVTLRSVSYAPAGSADILTEIDLHIPAGTRVALVGPSGAGKSTLLSLIPRLRDTTEGAVLIGGVDVRDIDPARIGDHVSAVFQEVFLFDDDVEANLRVARPDATEDELARAAHDAAFDGVVESLPDGWRTRLGDDGGRLSGGERARLAIARAIVADAPVLLVDEATAPLDSANEHRVLEALGVFGTPEEPVGSPTTVIVTHRLRTITRCDLIVYLEGGRIVERGTHDELLRNAGAYARFVDSAAPSV